MAVPHVLFHVPHVHGYAAYSQKTALLVNHFLHLFQGPAPVLHQVEEDGRVHIAGPGAHHHSAEGAESQAGVYGPAALHRRDGRAVAKVAGDCVHLIKGAFEDLGGPLGNELVAGAVEAVAPHSKVLVKPVGQSVEVIDHGHGLMEGGVEYGNVGYSWKGLHRRPYPHDVGWVMQGGHLADLFQSGKDLFIDQNATGELLSTVDHPVTAGGYLLQ